MGISLLPIGPCRSISRFPTKPCLSSTFIMESVPFIKGSKKNSGDVDSHSHEHSHSHASNGNEHGHTHEIMEHAGKFGERDLPNFAHRNWNERAFTVGIGG